MEAVVPTEPRTTSPVGVAGRMAEIRRFWGGKSSEGMEEIAGENSAYMDDSEAAFLADRSG